MPHGQHAQASNLLRTVEDDRRKPAGHLTVQPNLDALQRNKLNQELKGANKLMKQAPVESSARMSGWKCYVIASVSGTNTDVLLLSCKEHLHMEAVLSYRLDLVFTLDQQVQQLLSVDSGLPVVGHQPNERCVPLVGNLCEGGAAAAHQHLPDAVLKGLEGLIIHPQESLQAAGITHLSVPQKYSSLCRLCHVFCCFAKPCGYPVWPGKTWTVQVPISRQQKLKSTERGSAQ